MKIRRLSPANPPMIATAMASWEKTGPMQWTPAEPWCAFGVAASETPCVRKGGRLLANGSCDFGRIVRLNAKGNAHQHGKKGWKIDDNGDCDATADGDVECGQEPRVVTRKEWYAVRCPEGSEYIDGRCLVPTSDEEIRAMPRTA